MARQRAFISTSRQLRSAGRQLGASSRPLPSREPSLQAMPRAQAKLRAQALASHQQGAAIVTALLVVALATVIVSTLFYRESVAVRSIENRATMAQTRWIERAVIDWAKVILRSSPRNVDSASSIWATPVVETQLDETSTGGAKIGDTDRQVMLAGRIHDAQSKFNVNSLVSSVVGGNTQGNTQNQNGTQTSSDGSGLSDDNSGSDQQGGVQSNIQVSALHLKALKRLMGILSLPESLADQIRLRVQRAAAQRRQGSSQSSDTMVMPLLRFDDLRDLPGFDEETMLKLEPHLTVLPSDATTVNVNTASVQVLEAVAEKWNPAAIRSFVADRDVSPATELSSPLLRLDYGTTLDTTLVDVKSTYFIADGIIRYDRVESHTQTLLKRPQTGAVQVIWQHRN